MPSLIEALVTRQAEVPGQVERLREQIARPARVVPATPSSTVPGAGVSGGDDMPLRVV